ncbi:MAG TPA: carbamoyltransferase HypF [Anaerolineaceae bacterium]|nr:carbamoyltransferase HypF [Anaerolineaceae bacterium]
MTDQAGLRVRVRGIVQGVGFRPFVYGLAIRNQLTGWVRNTSSGVEIEVNGRSDGLNAFLTELQQRPPLLARIDSLVSEAIQPDHYTQFDILESQPDPNEFIPVSPDTTICPDCQRELFDPANRRYRYPFINCTNCGPRFSIIRDIPYDRPFTTMADFQMCPVCQAEYHDPLDRRFHAQPIACPTCGPQLWFEVDSKHLAEREDALQRAREWLKNGKILAVKGLGGYHLACDATNADAVNELRRRKKRSDKPFALMAFSLEQIERHCQVTPAERGLLTSLQHPIVLLERKPESTIAPSAAPMQKMLGFMLPYTPQHLLLLEPEAGFPTALVMTSGNLSEEPIAYRDGEAHERLTGLADAFLQHDRGIHMRVDDSVVRTHRNKSYFIRRSRGYAPDPLILARENPPLLAAGAELKNTFCLTRQRYAFLSHYIGDMENYETLRSFEEGIQHYERLFRIQPQVLAADLHPDYLATRYAQTRASAENLPLFQVQHHHAHLAACLADNGWQGDEPVIGACFDGTGYGTDGGIWGSEFLVGGYKSYQRAAHLKVVPLPGGDQAVRKVARMALAHLWAAGIEWEPDIPAVDALCAEERTVLHAQLTRSLNAPPTSSMGRLFDAAAALIGVRQTATYEGQAAIELEQLADPSEIGAYPFSIQDGIIDPAPLWHMLLRDWRAGTAQSVLAARFHNSVARLTVEVCQQLSQTSGTKVVALSGGVWQNMLLLEKTHNLLEADGFTVLSHRRVPANDGCIALGQAVVAGSQIL